MFYQFIFIKIIVIKNFLSEKNSSKNTPISTFMKPPLTPPSQGEDGLNLGKR